MSHRIENLLGICICITLIAMSTLMGVCAYQVLINGFH